MTDGPTLEGGEGPEGDLLYLAHMRRVITGCMKENRTLFLGDRVLLEFDAFFILAKSHEQGYLIGSFPEQEDRKPRVGPEKSGRCFLVLAPKPSILVSYPVFNQP